MTNKEMVYLLENQQLLSSITGVKASYAINKNLKRMLEEYKILISYRENAIFKEFEAKRIELAIKHSEKDNQNNPISVNSQYKIIDLNSFNLEWDLIRKAYPEIVKMEIDFNNLLNENYTGEIYKVKSEFLPENITTQQMALIFEFIEE